jgi:4-alpha-glucanotransferase
MTALADLAQLAALRGVQASFRGTDGREHRADEDVVLAVLRALGTPIGSAAEASDALAELQRARADRPLEPVLVTRVGMGMGMAGSATVTLPAEVHPRDVWCTIELEEGGVVRRRLTSSIVGMVAGVDPRGRPAHRYRFGLEPGGSAPLRPGYHRFVVEWPSSRADALLICAPRCPAPSRGWGAFLPLHAVRTERDWGVGSYSDLADLGRWVCGLGGSMVGALPLYPAFLDPPADPSPYLPVSRLAYNELFVDPTALPEFAAAPAAPGLLADAEFAGRLAREHDAPVVDYEEVARLRRQVLLPMAEALLATGGSRRNAFCAFFDAHPELRAYAQFRAGGERARCRGEAAPHRHDAPAGAPAETPTLAYHLYAQWAAAQQLASAAEAAPLYADLPIGVHPDGFDPFWAPGSFATRAHGGAPPDLFFAGGQDWAFPPLHPDGMRDEGYDYFIGTLRRAFRHAAYVRIDHVMGLQRLYWIPEGYDARHGAYVSYRAEELHAIVALEAHRAGVVVVGEDLGTVPDSVRERMARDAMLRSWVLQFESTPEDPLPAPPEAVLASWGTHDLPRFTAFFFGDDIDEEEAAGRIPPAAATAARADRARWRHSLLQATGVGAETPDAPGRALRACLDHLARSDAALVLVDLEELWGERQPQNHPGTGTGGMNWRRRAAYTLEEARRDSADTEFLRRLQGLRAEGGRPRPVAASR